MTIDEEITAIREAIGHTTNGPAWDDECQGDLLRLQSGLLEHENFGCPASTPGLCDHTWAANRINTYCRRVIERKKWS